MNRRKFLSAATTGAAVVSAAGLTAMATTAGTDQDAPLRAAWQAYCNALVTFRTIPSDTPDEVFDHLGDEMDRWEEEIERLRAHSPDGIAIKLKYLLSKQADSDQIGKAIIAGQQPTGDMGGSYLDQMMLSLIDDVRRL